MNPTLEGMWMEYANAVKIPSGSVQWIETKRVFFAGCTILLSELKSFNGSQAKGVEFLEQLERECRVFYLAAKSGNA